MALRLTTVRLLVADDVGIGKTIEAGLIARELLDRGEVKRIAVLCPPHLCEQWRTELREKFHIDAVVVRSGTASKLERGIPNGSHIFSYYQHLIVSLDYAKAERRRALSNENSDLVAQNRLYVMRITGDNAIGKAELDNFILPESQYPVIVTTSKLMTTGVDAQTCKLIVLDRSIGSMTKFKQIIGRGTRINEDFGKNYFTIIDFKQATRLFADPNFDGDPVQIYSPAAGEPPIPPDDADDSIPEDTEVIIDREQCDFVRWTQKWAIANSCY